MGNNQSGTSTARVGLPSLKLKWKSGKRDTPIPYADAKNKSFEELCEDEQFRYYVYSNLHDDYLMSSLLIDYDAEMLIENIEFLNPKDDEAKTKLLKEIELFENVLATDIKYNLSDVSKWNENVLKVNTNFQISPFVIAFQKRLAVLRSFESSITLARANALKTKDSRQHNSIALNSDDFPQLRPLNSLKLAGLEFLKSFPKLYAMSELESVRELLLSPLLALCTDIKAFDSLSLFSSWAPRICRPKKSMSLSSCKVIASSGEASKAIDKLPNTCWVSNGRRGVWGLFLNEPTLVSDLCITWVSGGSTLPLISSCGAPESLTIYAKTNMDDTLFKLKSYDTNEVFKAHGTWKQNFAVDGKRVSYLEIHMRGFACANRSNSIKMYNCEVLCVDDQTFTVDPLVMCSDMLFRFFDVLEFESLRPMAFSAMLSILKSVGSLSLIVKFVRYVLANSLEKELLIHSSTAMDELMHAVWDSLALSIKEKEAMESNNPKIKFDDERKSDRITLSDNNSSLHCHSASFTSPAYAQVSASMDSGVWEWEISIVDESTSLTYALGVGLNPVISVSESSTDMWTIRCITTPASQFMQTERSAQLQIRQFDVCHLTFDSLAGTLRAAVNGVDQGIQFEGIPAGVSPLVVFYETGACRLLSIKSTPKAEPVESITISSTDDSHVLNPESIQISVDEPSKSIGVIDLLCGIASIAKSKLGMMELGLSGSSSFVLEYPFAIEVSKDCIDELFSLIVLIMESKSPTSSTSSIVAVLEILEAQFSNLENTKPEDIGYASYAHAIDGQIGLLNVLMASSDSLIQTAAAKVFARGSGIFLPLISDRIKLASSLISESLSVNDPKFYLLRIVFYRLSSYNGVVNALDDHKSSFQSGNVQSPLMDLCSRVLDFVSKANIASSLTTDELAEFRSQAIVFLIRLLEILTLEIVKNSSPNESSLAIFASIFRDIALKCCGFISSLSASSSVEQKRMDSSIPKLLHPLLHTICFCSVDIDLALSIHPFLTALLRDLSKMNHFVEESVTASKLYNLALPIRDNAAMFEGGNKGWHQIPALFEPDSSYTVDENGCLYESVTSSNTCAVVNVSFTTPQKAAWEFELTVDSAGDECSVFGAAQIPFSSRCYSSSPDLWMRRAYNGNMYNRGRTLDSLVMEKVHPGDIVRIEFDGKAGTLSYGINGQDPEVGFVDVTGAISPSCGSYRSGVKVRLLKIEVYQSTVSSTESEDLSRAPSAIQWTIDNATMQSRVKDILSPIRDKSDKKEAFEVIIDAKRKVATAKSDVGVNEGVHEWSFEILELSRSHLGIGIVTKDVEASQTLGSQAAIAWMSDGSLWSNGEKLVDQQFFASLFPLMKNTVVSMRLDLSSFLDVSFFINGSFTGAPFNDLKLPVNRHKTYFPAACVTSPFQMLKIRTGGFDSSVVFPFYLFLLKSTSSSFARMTGAILNGPIVDSKEVLLLPWLRSPLLVGGLDEQYLREFQHVKSWKRSWNNGFPSLVENGDVHKSVGGKIRRESSLDASIDLFLSKIVQDSIIDGETPIYKLFEDWLSDIVEKDNPLLRSALEKSKSFSFPRCERPFIAAMLKHGGLFQEAMIAVLDLQQGKTPSPSNDMKALWKKVRQLRVYLRQQRQLFNSSDIRPIIEDSASHPTSEDINSDAHGAGESSIPPLLQPVLDIFAFFVSSSIVWIDQINVNSVFDASYTCKVIAVGIDSTNELMYIKFHARCDNSMGSLQPPSDSILLFGSIEVTLPAHQYDVENLELEVIGCLRFELSSSCIDAMAKEEVHFVYGKEGYSPAKLILPVENDEPPLQEVISPSSFEEVCDRIESNSLFLLKLVYAGNAELSKSMLQRSQTPEKPKSGTNAQSEGNDKWKKVVDFLRVHTSLKRERSGALPTESFLDDKEDDQFSANTALKACSLFVISDTSASPTALLDIIQRRNSRIASRTFALDAVAEVLSESTYTVDISMLQEVCIFLKASICSPSALSDIGSTKVHYLNSLEGCSSIAFRQLQDSFMYVFSQITNVLSEQIDLLERSSFSLQVIGKTVIETLTSLLSLWHMQFSSRDHKFLLDCGLLKLLYKLSSYSFYEKVVQSYIESAAELITHKESSSRHLEYYIRPFLSSTISTCIQNGTLSVRELVFSIRMLPEKLISSAEKDALGISGDPTTLMTSLSPSQATTIFQKAIKLLRIKEAFEKKKLDAEIEEKTRIDKAKHEAELAAIATSGVPLFDNDKKADDVYLDNFYQSAGVRAGRLNSNVASVFATVCYDVSQGSADSGNYFEITVLELGTRDIGVGLGTSEHFRVSGVMPGWEDHSYGYHGDDGRKFGAGNSPETWPLFEQNDVIGCGFDFDRRSIFYTRNGELLGTGFYNVADVAMYPIFGFHAHSVSQKISINFGVIPFRYEGPEVVVNAKSLLERESRRLHSIANEIIPILASSLGQKDLELTEEGMITITTSESVDSEAVRTPTRYGNAFEQTFKELRLRVETHSRVLRDIKRCQYFYRSLLRFLLVLICENDSTLPVWNESFSLDYSKYNSNLLTKGRSTFGTPKYETYGDGAMLHLEICSFFSDELHSASSRYPKDTIASPDRSSSGSKHSLKLLDVFDVDEAVYHYLLSLRCGIHLSKQIKTILTKEEFVISLLRLIELSSPRVQEIIVHLLRSIVPAVAPENIETALESSSWSSALISSLVPPEIKGVTRRSRKLPESFVRILFESIKRSVQFGFSHNSKSFYGTSSALMHRGALNATLIHQLLENASYAELVSCFLTESIRSIEEIVERTSQLQTLNSSFADAFAGATASCFVVSGLTSKLCKGSLVRTLTGQQGSILSYDEQSQKAVVLLSSSLKGVQDLVTLSRREFSLVSIRILADLSSLSQPLVPQLISLFKRLLEIMISSGTNEAEKISIASFQFWRLSASLSLALSTLINSKHDAIVDAIQYAGILFSIVAISLRESPLEHFVSSEEVLDMWTICQSRCLEFDVLSGLEDSSTDETPVVEEIVQTISVDPTPAPKESEIEVALVAEYEEDVDGPQDIIPSVEDFALFKQPVGDQLILHADAQTESVVTGRTGYSRIETIPLDNNTIFEEGDLVSQTATDSCTTNGRIGQPLIDSTPIDSEMVVSYFHQSWGMQFSELVKSSDLSIVKGFYGCKSLVDLRSLMLKLDKSLVILQMREIVLSLLFENSVNLLSDTSKLEDWIKLIKLSTVSAGEKFKSKSVRDLCAALIKASTSSLRDGNEVSPKRLLSILLADALSNLVLLMSPRKNQSNVAILKSEHPFIEPEQTEHSISIPEGRYYMIFDRRSSTPSKLARLNVYCSESEFKTESPTYSFFGPPGSPRGFKSRELVNVKQLYFKFIAEKGSDKPNLDVRSKDSNVTLDAGQRSMKHKGTIARSGTGEDDSLSNFFDAKVVPTYESSYASCDCDFISSGTWFFETTCVFGERDGETAPYLSSTEFLSSVRVGLVDNSFDFASSSDTGAFLIDCNGNFSQQLSELKVFEDGVMSRSFVGCYFTFVESKLFMKFAVNGEWTDTVETSFTGVGVKPAFTISGDVTYLWNFGETPFAFPPDDTFEPIICRPGSFDSSLSWGYELEVFESSSCVPYTITRSFDLLWSSKGHDGSPPVYIWRQKCATGYTGVGDILTKSKQVPLGALSVATDFCSPPLRYELVFSCSKTSISIWRPIPDEGYVSLGDIFYYSSDVTVEPSRDLCICIPIHSAKKVQIGPRDHYAKISKDSRTTHMSLWGMQGNLGLFCGSKSVSHAGIDLGNLYSFGKDVLNELTGEWFSERSIVSDPSISWACQVLDFLLDNVSGSDSNIFSSSQAFSILVDYVYSNTCPNPFKVVSVLIKFIRTGAEKGFSIIQLGRLKSLCKAVSNMITAKSNDSKKSYGHQLLVDLAVEFERYRLLMDSPETFTSSNFKFIESWATEVSDADKSLARLGEVSILKKHFVKDSVLQTIRNIMSFFYTLEDVEHMNLGNRLFDPSSLSFDLIRKIWFESMSLFSLEESSHPHGLEAFTKLISVPGAEKIMVTIDRRSDISENSSLRITGGSSSFVFKGGENADVYAKPIIFSCSELQIVFEPGAEASDAIIDNWGWAVLVDCCGAAYETRVVKTKLNEYITGDSGSTTLTPLLSPPESIDVASEEIVVAEADSGEAKDSVEESLLTALVADETLTSKPEDPVPNEDLPKEPLVLTDELLAKAFEIGKLVDSNEIALHFETDNTIELSGSISVHENARDPLLYVVSFMYNTPSGIKTIRTPLSNTSVFKMVAPKVSSIAYTFHCVYESKLREFSIEIAPVAPIEALPAETEHTPGVPGWTCGVCTFVNLTDDACLMCNNANPAAASSTAELQVSWFCRACTLINIGNSSTRCTACDTDRTSFEAVDAAETNPDDDDEDEDSESESDQSDNGNWLAGPNIVSNTAVAGSILQHLGGLLVRPESESFVKEDKALNGAGLPQSDSATITIKYTYTNEQRFEVRLWEAMKSPTSIVPAGLHNCMRKWNHHYDNILIEFINSQNINNDELSATRPSLPKESFQLHCASSFYNFSLMDIHARASLLRVFNNSIKDILPSLNLLNADPRSLGAMVRRYNRYIFLSVKQPLLDAALEETQVSSGSGLPASLLLSNFKSFTSKEKKEIEPSKSTNCFVQAFTQLQKKDVKVFKHIFSGDRIFQITFENESGIDAGGVFREGMSRIIEDLFSDDFNLLVLCPNGKHNVHLNTEKYLPNPAHTGIIEIQMLEFIGRLMGGSMRAKLCLPFEFPPIVWKRLVGDEINDEDLLSFDAITYRQIVEIRDCDKNGISDQDLFEEKFEEKIYFCCHGCDGLEHELIPGGKSIAVNFANRADYYSKVVFFRLHEFDVHIAAIRRGLEDVVPIHLLQLFSWQQTEFLVAGNPAFDIALWKSRTDSEGVSSKTSSLFWKVMETLTPKELSGFVRFAWGRSRLPPEKLFSTKMKLTDGGRASLPVSHTCFFSIELPAYETEAEMRRGLLTAIHFGVGGILMG